MKQLGVNFGVNVVNEKLEVNVGVNVLTETIRSERWSECCE